MSVKFEKVDNLIIAKLPSEPNQELLDEVEKHAKTLEENKPAAIAFDFSQVGQVKPDDFRIYTLCARAYRKHNLNVYAYGLKALVLSEFKVKGLDTVFSVKKDFSEVQALFAKANKPALNVTFLNPFIQATVHTLKVQANTDVQIGKPFLKTEEIQGVDIAGIISLSTNGFKGAIALCFPGKVFLGIYNNMFGENVTEINKEIEDAAGEMMNIIFGQAKIELNDKHGHSIEKAIPTVVRATNLSVRHMTASKGMILPFKTAFGDFHLEITLE